jgi:hypothetical protein
MIYTTLREETLQVHGLGKNLCGIIVDEYVSLSLERFLFYCYAGLLLKITLTCCL